MDGDLRQARRQQVYDIYNYLYGFSIQRLQRCIDSPHMMVLIVFYLSEQGFARIEKVPNLRKERAAYLEAVERLLSLSPCRLPPFAPLLHYCRAATNI